MLLHPGRGRQYQLCPCQPSELAHLCPCLQGQLYCGIQLRRSQPNAINQSLNASLHVLVIEADFFKMWNRHCSRRRNGSFSPPTPPHRAPSKYQSLECLLLVSASAKTEQLTQKKKGRKAFEALLLRDMMGALLVEERLTPVLPVRSLLPPLSGSVLPWLI